MPGSDVSGSVQLLDDPVGGPGGAPGRDPLIDIALGPALLQQVTAVGGPETLRLYRPQPTVAFSGRDCAGAGIGAAGRIARAAGFVPVRRGPGGRAAAYDRGALCLDHVGVDAAGPAGIRPRFVRFADLLAQALRSVGVDARIGPVPGEYCPGEFSINDGHGHKLVGTAQRLVRGGWLFSTSIQVGDLDPVRDVLTGAYDALGLDWEPRTVGAVQTTAPGVTVPDVAAAVLAAYARFGPQVTARIGADLLDLAVARADRHQLPTA